MQDKKVDYVQQQTPRWPPGNTSRTLYNRADLAGSLCGTLGYLCLRLPVEVKLRAKLSGGTVARQRTWIALECCLGFCAIVWQLQRHEVEVFGSDCDARNLSRCDVRPHATVSQIDVCAVAVPWSRREVAVACGGNAP